MNQETPQPEETGRQTIPSQSTRVKAPVWGDTPHRIGGGDRGLKQQLAEMVDQVQPFQDQGLELAPKHGGIVLTYAVPEQGLIFYPKGSETSWVKLKIDATGGPSITWPDNRTVDLKVDQDRSASFRISNAQVKIAKTPEGFAFKVEAAEPDCKDTIIVNKFQQS